MAQVGRRVINMSAMPSQTIKGRTANPGDPEFHQTFDEPTRKSKTGQYNLNKLPNTSYEGRLGGTQYNKRDV